MNHRHVTLMAILAMQSLYSQIPVTELYSAWHEQAISRLSVRSIIAQLHQLQPEDKNLATKLQPLYEQAFRMANQPPLGAPAQEALNLTEGIEALVLATGILIRQTSLPSNTNSIADIVIRLNPIQPYLSSSMKKWVDAALPKLGLVLAMDIIQNPKIDVKDFAGLEARIKRLHDLAPFAGKSPELLALIDACFTFRIAGTSTKEFSHYVNEKQTSLTIEQVLDAFKTQLALANDLNFLRRQEHLLFLFNVHILKTPAAINDPTRPAINELLEQLRYVIDIMEKAGESPSGFTIDLDENKLASIKPYLSANLQKFLNKLIAQQSKN